MEIKRLNIIISLGFVAIIGILVAQLLWTRQAYHLEDKKFNQKVNLALLEVVKKLYGSKVTFTENPVQNVANDYYVVNINNEFDPGILEHYLKTEFTRFQINTDYVYAVYNCHSDRMVYGRYVSTHEEDIQDKVITFPKHKNLVYYFSIRFPDKTAYLVSSLKFWYLLTIALIIILFVYVYSIYTIIQQKKFSELQRDFINNMTHEFKTPLSSILLAAEALHQQEEIQNSKKLKTYASIIANQGNKLNLHIEKILNIAKNDASGVKLNLQKLNLSLFLNDIKNQIEQKNENVKIDIQVENSTHIVADEFHFSNMVHNIIDNSIKYCEENPHIQIFETKDAKGLYLKFKDNGIGISNHNINSVFTQFYRINTQRSDEVSGFGLGLFYVKKMVQLHHWKISLQNNTDKGITLSIFTPYQN